MTNKADTNAAKAYQLGKKAAKDGQPITANPYVTRRVIGLHNWWDKGWYEEQQDYKQEIGSHNDYSE